jgi:serine protease Do
MDIARQFEQVSIFLADESGRVIGINTMILRGTEGIGFAIPIETALEEFEYYLSKKM